MQLKKKDRDEFTIRIPKPLTSELKQEAKENYMSLNAYIVHVLKDRILT